MKRLKWLLGGAVVLFLLIAIVVWVALGQIVKKAIETAGPHVTGTPVAVDSVSLSPLNGAGTIHELVIANPEGFQTAYAFHMERMDVDIDPATVLSDPIVIEDVVIENADILFEVKGKNLLAGFGGTNLGRIKEHIDALATEEAESEAAAGGKIIVRHFLLKEAKIHLANASSPEPLKTLTLPDVELIGIGEKSGGVTATEAANQIFGPLTAAIVKTIAANESMIGQLKEKAAAMKETAKDAAGKATEKLKGLFNKE